MATSDLEQRVSRLEQIIEQMRRAALQEPGRDDWQSSIGILSGNPVANEIIDEALQLREEERRQARQ
jgi:hypothetical protein